MRRFARRGVHFKSAEELIETILPTPREAGLLLTTKAMSMLQLRRRSMDAHGRPIEMVRALYRGDHVAFQTTLIDDV